MYEIKGNISASCLFCLCASHFYETDTEHQRKCISAECQDVSLHKKAVLKVGGKAILQAAGDWVQELVKSNQAAESRGG